MVGIEMWLTQFTGGNETLLMLSVAALFLVLNFIVNLAVEIKNKDLRWNDLARFLKALLLNAVFLFGLELLMIPASRMPLVYDIFLSVQMGGWLGVMAFYFYGLYRGLKHLGLQANQAVEDRIANLVNPEKEEI